MSGPPNLPHRPDDPDSDSESVRGELNSETELPTISHQGGSQSELSEQFGRYESLELIAKGGFGNVFLGYDPDLDRKVAIKSLRNDRLQVSTISHLLKEARATAKLNHANIVQIFDVGHDTVAGNGYIVMEFIDGPSLAEVLKDERPPAELVVQWMIQVVRGLEHAHSHQLVHRDLKPANILIGPKNRVCVTDFGLALSDDPAHPRRRERAGTPPYMAPEQISGETHRIDGRTDLWAVGVTMYEAICGKRPFRGDSLTDLFESIRTVDPKSITHFQPDLSADFNRIVMRCLAKQRTNRFLTAHDLLQELSYLLDQLSASTSTPNALSGGSGLSSRSAGSSAIESGRAVRIVPKGLRSFDANDAEFFLQLLPGPHDRFGVPEQVRFWRSRIESREENDTFAVGLIYGPSGCGKSSLIRAGVIPLISDRVRCIYIDSSESKTEERIERALRKQYREIPKNWLLPDIIAGLRNGTIESSVKVTLILDQVEQWLQSNQGRKGSLLAQALRQCDGVNVQTVLIVRDDFIMAANDLMAELEIPVSEGSNASAVQRFSQRHARKVLAGFGRAFGSINAVPEELPPEQLAFLKQAVKELAVDDRVIPVHLALFSELMKDKEWTIASLKSIGGTDGVGVAFLNETFSSSTSTKPMRRLEEPAMKLLEKLLPELGKDIRAFPCDREALMQATAAQSSAELDALLRVLDQELKIIAKTEVLDRADVARDTTYYQLSHDFLVSPIRRWIRSRKSSTWQGRAVLRVEELAENYQREHDSRFLPAPLEFATAAMVRSNHVDYTSSARQLMNEAWAYYGRRMLVISMSIVAVTASLWWHLQRQANSLARSEAHRILQVDARAHYPLLQSVLNQPNRWRVERELRRLDTDGVDSERRVAISRALLNGSPDKGMLSKALQEIENVPVGLATSLIQAVLQIESPSEGLWDSFHATDDSVAKSRLAILLAYTGEPKALESVLELNPDPSQRTIAIRELSSWHDDWSVIESLLDQPISLALKSGICFARGSEGLVDNERTLQRFEKLANDDSALTSAAGDWALRINKRQCKPVKDDAAEWFRQADGIKFVLIPANSFTKSKTHYDAFYLSDREISCSLFSTFVTETSAKWVESSTFHADHLDVPPTQVSFLLATSFCDWLSRRDGRLPFYDETIERAAGEMPDGYRLPTSIEFEAATRGGAMTNQPFGSNKLLEFAKYYEAFGENSVREGEWRLSPRGTLIPNSFGLFDMMGNVKEWTEYHSDPVPDYRPIWGATFRSSRFDLRLVESDRPPSQASGAIAFRVACNRRPLKYGGHRSIEPKVPR